MQYLPVVAFDMKKSEAGGRINRSTFDKFQLQRTGTWRRKVRDWRSFPKHRGFQIWNLQMQN